MSDIQRRIQEILLSQLKKPVGGQAKRGRPKKVAKKGAKKVAKKKVGRPRKKVAKKRVAKKRVAKKKVATKKIAVKIDAQFKKQVRDLIKGELDIVTTKCKKVKSDKKIKAGQNNPWVKFIQKYKREHPNIKITRQEMKRLAIAYRKTPAFRQREKQKIKKIEDDLEAI